MADLRTTLAATLGTVETTANILTTTINNVGRGMSMLDAYIGEKQEEQRIAITARADTRIKTIASRESHRVAAMNMDTERKLAADAAYAVHFQQHYDLLIQKLNK